MTHDPTLLERQQQRRNANRARRRASAAATATLCAACALRPREAGKKWCTTCLDRQRKTPGGKAKASMPKREKPPAAQAPLFFEVTEDDITDLERIFG